MRDSTANVEKNIAEEKLGSELGDILPLPRYLKTLTNNWGF
jgi:hypothetical protein